MGRSYAYGGSVANIAAGQVGTITIQVQEGNFTADDIGFNANLNAAVASVAPAGTMLVREHAFGAVAAGCVPSLGQVRVDISTGAAGKLTSGPIPANLLFGTADRPALKVRGRRFAMGTVLTFTIYNDSAYAIDARVAMLGELE